jgi:DNA-binding IclR family transcriptional regulator
MVGTVDPRQTPRAAERPEDFVQSVGRAVRVLEVVGERPGLPVKTIARRSGLNISTAYHLVRTLAYEGYLFRLPDGTYAIGDAVARRFHDLLRSMSRPPDSRVVLDHLTKRTGLSAYLGCLHDGQLTVAEVAEGPGSPYLEDFELGLHVSAHATALGKALLSALSRKQRLAYLTEQGMQAFTTRTRTDLEDLETDLAAVPPDQPVVEYGEFRDGVVCAARLVPAQGGHQPRWAVVVSCREEELSLQVQAEVVHAAKDLSAGTS